MKARNNADERKGDIVVLKPRFQEHHVEIVKIGKKYIKGICRVTGCKFKQRHDGQKDKRLVKRPPFDVVSVIPSLRTRARSKRHDRR